MLELQPRSIADYIEENMREPIDLRPVKETEEENTEKDSKIIYTLHDLSRGLKKLNKKSDLFEKNIVLPNVSSQSKVHAEIEEIDSEYEESSDEKNERSPTLSILIDKTEPLDESEFAIKKIKELPEAIQEEAEDSEFISEKFASKFKNNK